MKVSIYFPAESKRQKHVGKSLNVLIDFIKELDQSVVEKTMVKYSETLKNKFFFEKVTMKKVSDKSYIFSCVANRQVQLPISSASFMSYLSNIGFVEITCIDEFSMMEKQRILAIYNRYIAEVTQEKSFKKFVSRKVIMSKEEFTKLYKKLQITRDTIEQLSYRSEQTVDWFEKINDCDIILNYIDHYYWNIGLFIMIDIKVKRALYFYSDFYDNMKESELLTHF